MSDLSLIKTDIYNMIFKNLDTYLFDQLSEELRDDIFDELFNAIDPCIPQELYLNNRNHHEMMGKIQLQTRLR